MQFDYLPHDSLIYRLMELRMTDDFICRLLIADHMLFLQCLRIHFFPIILAAILRL